MTLHGMIHRVLHEKRRIESGEDMEKTRVGTRRMAGAITIGQTWIRRKPRMVVVIRQVHRKDKEAEVVVWHDGDGGPVPRPDRLRFQELSKHWRLTSQ